MSEENQTVEQRIANSLGLIIQNDERWNNIFISMAKKHDNLDDLGESIKDWIEENCLVSQQESGLNDIAHDLLDSAYQFCNYSELAEHWENSLRPKGIEYTIGEHFMSALINGDLSGLEPDDESLFTQWLETESFNESEGNWWHDSEADSEFADCEITGLSSDCVTIIWVAREEETEDTVEAV